LGYVYALLGVSRSQPGIEARESATSIGNEA
jgi:hypothetical protein